MKNALYTMKTKVKILTTAIIQKKSRYTIKYYRSILLKHIYIYLIFRYMFKNKNRMYIINICFFIFNS